MKLNNISNKHYLLFLGILFAIWWLLLAWQPYNRADWALENVLVITFVLSLIFFHKKTPLSNFSYTLIFIFLCLHEVGAHYTYEKVPYQIWSQAFFGSNINVWFGFERNHFDRLIHFGYGLLLIYPMRELLVNLANLRGFLSYLLPLVLSMSGSMVFELFEWGAAEFFDGDLGMAYLGTQGDIWDAHKDMLLATVGAILAIFFIAIRQMLFTQPEN